MGQGPPPSHPTLPLITPPPTCAHNEHVGAAAVASAWRDALGHHLGPSLQLQGLGVARELGAAGSWGHGQLPCHNSSSLASSPPSPFTLLPSHTHETPSHHRALHMLFPGPSCPPQLSLLPEPQVAPLPACWPGHTPSPSQSSPASAAVLRNRFWGAPDPVPQPPIPHTPNPT